MSDLPDSPRRFVAGAKCPQCQSLDKIVVFRSGGVMFRECVACFFREEMHFSPEFRELETRVNRSVEEREQAVQTVRFVDRNQAK